MKQAAKKMYPVMADSTPKSRIMGQIDENLKQIYNETLNEQVPDKLLQLLEQLRRKSGQAAADDDRDPS